VVIERPTRDTCAFGDLVAAGCGEALLGKELAGRPDKGRNGRSRTVGLPPTGSVRGGELG